jgi:glycosyltransferase involved in cell wall biosynthesis
VTGLLEGQSVALVHEWFSRAGGSENVFRTISEVLPHAETFVLWREPGAQLEGRHLRESWLANTPFRRSKALALPLMPLAWRTLTRSRFDVVLSSSHAFAHTVKLGEPCDTRHLSYVHSPARYVWSPDHDGRGAGSLLAAPRRALQAVDRRLSRHVHSYAANSHEVRNRIVKFWGRDAHVIHPPVDVAYFAEAPSAVQQQNRDYLLGVGRWVPYKNFDLMIQIAAAAKIPLVLAGAGPEEARLRRLAATVDVAVTFEHRPSRERLRELYWGAKALLFPSHEDFGIIPVEAQACCTPVVGLRRGGLLETVTHGRTGYLVNSTDPREFVPPIQQLKDLSPTEMEADASRFSEQQFMMRLAEWVRHETDRR